VSAGRGRGEGAIWGGLLLLRMLQIVRSMLVAVVRIILQISSMLAVAARIHQIYISSLSLDQRSIIERWIRFVSNAIVECMRN
jgi:hypothetical protein